jgi:hypothetical protein
MSARQPNQADAVWMGKLVAVGELVIGIRLIQGLFAGYDCQTCRHERAQPVMASLSCGGLLVKTESELAYGCSPSRSPLRWTARWH